MASTEEIDEYFDFIMPLAEKAGDILLEGYSNNEKRVNTKKDIADVVTEYDNQIEDFLMENILKRYPNHMFIAEESCSKNANIINELTDAPTWIIDPIDGTSNFIKQIPHTCVSIGLAVNKVIVLGIVNNSVQGKMYTSKLGQGAFCNGKPIHVSNVTNINYANVGYEVSLVQVAKVRDKHIRRIYHVGSNSRRLVGYGCVVDSLCLVAAGNLDAFHIEDMYPWDCAAGYLLITEAGGVVTHTEGGPFDVMRPDLICAGTEELRQEIERLIRKADEGAAVGGSQNNMK